MTLSGILQMFSAFPTVWSKNDCYAVNNMSIVRVRMKMAWNISGRCIYKGYIANRLKLNSILYQNKHCPIRKTEQDENKYFHGYSCHPSFKLERWQLNSLFYVWRWTKGITTSTTTIYTSFLHYLFILSLPCKQCKNKVKNNDLS